MIGLGAGTGDRLGPEHAVSERAQTEGGSGTGSIGPWLGDVMVSRVLD